MGTFVIKPTSATISDMTNATLVSGATVFDCVLEKDDGKYIQWKGDPASPLETTIRCGFTGDCVYLDGSVTPVAVVDLPAGFGLVGAQVELYGDIFNISSSQLYVQGDVGAETQCGVFGNGVTNTHVINIWSPSSDTIAKIVTSGCGLRLDAVLGGSDHYENIDQFTITGNYYLASVSGWYYNSSTDHYKYYDDDPGAPWALTTPPIPTSVSYVPIFVSPNGGTSVTATTTNVGDDATITVNGAPATDINVVDSTTVTFTAPPNPKGSGDVLIVNTQTSDTILDDLDKVLAKDALVYEDVPHPSVVTVTSISPAAGSSSGSDLVTITGTGFLTGALVTLGFLPASSVVVGSDTSITCLTPLHANGTVDVTVRNPDGGNGTLTGGFTFGSGVAVEIWAVIPETGSASGGESIGLIGDGFVAGASVYFGTDLAADVAVSGLGGIIVCTSPAHAAGTVDITVINPDGGGYVFQGGFTYGTDPVVIYYAEPSFGSTAGGDAITLIGRGFKAGGTIDFSLKGAALGVNIMSDSEARLQTPDPGAGLSDITFTNTDTSTYTIFDAFTFFPILPTIIWYVEPNIGLYSGGTSVTIHGYGFDFGATVSFGGVAATGVGWLDANTLVCTTPAHPVGIVDVVVANPDGDSATLKAGFIYGVEAPVVSATGWWLSVQDNFAGAANLLHDCVPRDPRTFQQLAPFSSTTGFMFGGFPGPSAVIKNRLIYARGDYSLGTNAPPIRLYDGTFDRLVATLPNTSTGTVSKAAVTMLAANDTIYIASFDSGTTSADWKGRVFNLDITTATMAEVGTGFATGHLPYALAWHMGRLWCGTNRKDIAAAGKIYSFRPGIDTAWVEDKDLAGIGGVTSLLSFNGLLYVGTSAPAGTFAKILVRGVDNGYDDSLTGSGGTAAVNNCFPALAKFGANLYATFWNPDTAKVSKIHKFDGASWSTVYTATGSTISPYIALPVDQDVLFAIGGGIGYNAVLLASTDGADWDNRSAFLTDSGTPSTGQPVFGVVVI